MGAEADCRRQCWVTSCPASVGSGMAGQTAAIDFSKEQTFPTLVPTFLAFHFLFLFPCNQLLPPLPLTLDYPDSLPGLFHISHSPGSSRQGLMNQISQDLMLVPQQLLELTLFPISECFSHELHSSCKII